VKFESRLTLLKYFFVKGMALSLICISGVVEAVDYQVTSTAGNQGGPGTMIGAVIYGNTNDGTRILFDTLPAGSTVGPFDAPLTITNSMIISALLPMNLTVTRDPLFDIVGVTTALTLVGDNDAGNVASWAGGMTNASTVIFDQRQTTNYAYVISGMGGVTAQVTPGQILTFSAANTYTGPTNITSGTLATGITDALPPRTALDISGEAFTIGNTFNQTVAKLTGGGGLNINGNSFTLNSTTNDTYSGVATGTGDFIKNGTGIQTLSGMNTATGPLGINDGGIKLPTGGSWSGPVTIGAATLEMNGGAVSGAIAGINTSILNVTGNFTPTTTITNIGTINVNTGGVLTVNHAISGYSALTVGAGSSAVLNTGGSLSNGIALNNGTFRYNNGTFTGNVIGAGNSTMDVYGNFSVPGTVNVNTLNVRNGGTFTTNALTAIHTLLNVDAGGTLLLGSNLTMPGASILTNAGALTMNGNNLLMGTNSIFNSNSNLTTTGSIGLAPGSTGYTLNVGAASTFTANNPISGYNGLTIAGGSSFVLNNGGSLSNGIALNNGTFRYNGGIFTGNVIGAGNSTMDVYGNFSVPGTVNVNTLNVHNGGTFTTNALTSITTLLNVDAGGTLLLGSDLTMPGASTLTNAGILTMNGHNLLMGSNSTFNSNSNLTPTGSIGFATGSTGYTLNVGAGSTFTVNNSVSGYTALNVIANSTLVLNNGGILSNGVALNNSIFTINGGTLSGNITTTGSPSTLNINTTFTPPGVVNVDTLNVNNGATFTPNTTVTTNTALNVNPGTTLLLTNNIGGAGTVFNAGTITHTQSATRTLSGNFIQQSTGTINIAIANPQQYSQFLVNGHTTLNGGTMNIALSDPTVINGGEVFNVITSTGGITNNALPTVPKTSLFITFTPIVNGNTLELITDRKSYNFFNNIPALNGIATGLDGLITLNQFNPLLSILDQQSSQDAFSNKLDQLAPMGLNGIYTAQGIGTQDQILLRLDTIRGMGIGGALARAGYTRTGYAAGDMMENQGTYGPMVFGNSAKQSNRAGLRGYNAFTAGFGFAGDVPILQYFRVGLGASYANSAVKESNNTGSNTTIGSTQGMAYGSATYGPLFLDAVLSAGINSYHGKRNITFLGKTATSAYMGSQYGAKVKTGFTIPYDQIEISPTAGFQYMHLNIGRYTEKDASLVNLTVDATRFSTVRASLGARIADRGQEEDFFPEIHAFYIVDVRNPNVMVTARFVDGGGSFVSTSALPPKAGINVGASITALVSDNFMLSGAYDLEAKKSFRRHSASLKFKYLF
jgi:fibronectin-binding autotransporter adhesin